MKIYLAHAKRFVDLPDLASSGPVNVIEPNPPDELTPKILAKVESIGASITGARTSADVAETVLSVERTMREAAESRERAALGLKAEAIAKLAATELALATANESIAEQRNLLSALDRRITSLVLSVNALQVGAPRPEDGISGYEVVIAERDGNGDGRRFIIKRRQ